VSHPSRALNSIGVKILITTGKFSQFSRTRQRLQIEIYIKYLAVPCLVDKGWTMRREQKSYWTLFLRCVKKARPTMIPAMAKHLPSCKDEVQPNMLRFFNTQSDIRTHQSMHLEGQGLACGRRSSRSHINA
jgi:hypothetical protein